MDLPLSKKRKRSDEQQDNESKVPKKESAILDPLTFPKWKKESIASLLCSPIEQGGAHLSLDYAQTLYDEQFGGGEVDYLMFKINRGFDLNELFARPLPEELPLNIKETVVEWVKNLFERKLYHLWSNEKLLSEVCKPIQEGGAGLNNNDLVNIPNLKEFVINSSNIENQIEKLIIDWKNSFLIQYEPIDFSSFGNNQRFYLKIKELLANSKDLDDAVQSIYQNCYKEEKKRVNNISNVPTIEELIKLVKCKGPKVKLIYANELEISELKGVKLPIVKKGEEEYVFNKHHLPFIPSLHYENEFDKQVVSEIEQSTIPTFILISPSGIGKTSLMIRTLCKYPGIFISGTSSNENGATVDLASRKLMQQLPQSESPSRLFATVRQLSFNQLNGNTENDRQVFEQLFQYEWCEILDLRKLTIDSIKFLKQKLSNLSNIYNSDNLDKLIICVDEANIFEEYSSIKYISCGGNERGFLSVLTYEIERLKNDYLESSFYAGTSFSVVDISNIVQSILMKNEAKPNILTLAQFPKLDKKEFFEYISKHIVLDSVTRDTIEKKNSFPIRIRQASFFLEKYINAKLHNFKGDLIYTFDSAFNTAFKEIRLKITEFIAIKDKGDYFRSIKDTLFNYIIHFRFGKLFGTNFFEHDQELASTLLTSGLTNPTNYNLNAFEANDYLGYMVALEMVGQLNEKGVTVMNLAEFWLRKTRDPKQVEKIIMLCLTQLKPKPLKEYFPTGSQINKLTESIFNCHTLVTANGYLEFCVGKGIKPENENGELLYMNNIINKQWDLLYGVAFYPSNEAHPDIMLLIEGCDGNPLLLTFSIKCLTGITMESNKLSNTSIVENRSEQDICNIFSNIVEQLQWDDLLLEKIIELDMKIFHQVEEPKEDRIIEISEYDNIGKSTYYSKSVEKLSISIVVGIR